MKLRLLHIPILYCLFACCAILTFHGTEKAAAEEATKRPNFLIFMADDQYKTSIGCYGADPSHTPNIDAFAAEAMRFTRCFTESSCCTPNRGVFLSAMYPLRNGAHANHSGFFNGVKSMPNYMKELGYRACLVNKEVKWNHWRDIRMARRNRPCKVAITLRRDVARPKTSGT